MSKTNLPFFTCILQYFSKEKLPTINKSSFKKSLKLKNTQHKSKAKIELNRILFIIKTNILPVYLAFILIGKTFSMKNFCILKKSIH